MLQSAEGIGFFCFLFLLVAAHIHTTDIFEDAWVAKVIEDRLSLELRNELMNSYRNGPFCD